MTQQDWIQAINESPKDKELRLIYSDWLEDYGRQAEAEAWREKNDFYPYLSSNYVTDDGRCAYPAWMAWYNAGVYPHLRHNIHPEPIWLLDIYHSAIEPKWFKLLLGDPSSTFSKSGWKKYILYDCKSVYVAENDLVQAIIRSKGQL